MLIKVLEHKWVVRLFGVLLIIAPFFNTAFMISRVENVPDHWTNTVIFKVVASASPTWLLLQAASIVIGILMLRGRAAAWKYTLVLISLNIAVLVPQLARIKTDKSPLLFLFIDACLFLFIADQLVWKVPEFKRKPKPVPAAGPVADVMSPPIPQAPAPQVVPLRPVETPVPVQPVAAPQPPVRRAPQVVKRTSKRIIFNLEGYGNWAQLIEISDLGICLRCLVPKIPNVTTKPMEMDLAPGLRLNLRFTKQEGSDYYFEYVSLEQKLVTKLNQWIEKVA